MNIGDVKTHETLPVHITLPGADLTPTSVVVHVMSFDSKEVQKVQNAHVNKQMDLQIKKGKSPTVERAEALRIEKLATAVKKIDWNEDDWFGEKPAPSVAFFADVIDKAPWFATQIEEVAEMSDAFFVVPKPTSKK